MLNILISGKQINQKLVSSVQYFLIYCKFPIKFEKDLPQSVKITEQLFLSKIFVRDGSLDLKC